MKRQIAITGYGLSAGGYDNEQDFFRHQYTHAFAPLDELSQIDVILDKYLEKHLGKTLRINKFNYIDKKDPKLKTGSIHSYQICSVVKQALKKADLLKMQKSLKEKISIVHNIMYPVLHLERKHCITPIKTQWEQQTPNFIGSIFDIRGPQYINRESEHSSLATLDLFTRLIDKEKTPIVVLTGLSVLHPTFTRMEMIHELDNLKNHGIFGHDCAIPTDYSELAACLVIEEYDHAVKRGANIYAKIKTSCHSRFHTDYSNPHTLKESIYKCICAGKNANPDMDTVFGSFNQNIMLNTSEFECIQTVFPKSKIICTRKILGQCPPLSGLLAIIISVSGFNNGCFPSWINTKNEIHDNTMLETRPDEKVNHVWVQSLTSSGEYVGISLYRGQIND